jgi:hypothetical protein
LALWFGQLSDSGSQRSRTAGVPVLEKLFPLKGRREQRRSRIAIILPPAYELQPFQLRYGFRDGRSADFLELSELRQPNTTRIDDHRQCRSLWTGEPCATIGCAQPPDQRHRADREGFRKFCFVH